jgi:hypothetical protein
MGSILSTNGPSDKPGTIHNVTALEEFVPRGHLRVAAILDLARAGTLAVRMVPTVREFAHDALEVVRTRDI